MAWFSDVELTTLEGLEKKWEEQLITEIKHIFEKDRERYDWNSFALQGKPKDKKHQHFLKIFSLFSLRGCQSEIFVIFFSMWKIQENYEG